ncbi:MAG: YqeG family HAD IIIA-type phosphatase [Desulfotomaculaceae bacterium]|nr:YqeG family HAD IIIA-type phosphatase [Desulfotomaculaceae bacterium]
MLKIFYPRIFVASVTDIQVEMLRKLGIKGILFDLDNTIVSRDSNQFPQHILYYLNMLRAQGFKLGIISNNGRRRVTSIAGLLEIPAVPRAIKPWARPFRRAMKMLGTSASETALVGDQIFTDILGGNLAGLHTILVVPMKGKDFLGSRLISRPLERLVLARLSKYTEVLHEKRD